MTMWIRPLSSARSDRGWIGRCRSASIAVLVTRGSTTISVLPGLASSRRQRIGWLSAMLAPISRMTSARLEILVGAGRAVAAERPLVAGDRGRHAQRGVAVVVARAEAELHQLAERVELLGDELAGADDADRTRARSVACTSRNRRRHRRRCASSQLTRVEPPSPSQQRIARAVRRVERVVLRQPLRAQQRRGSPDDPDCRAR